MAETFHEASTYPHMASEQDDELVREHLFGYYNKPLDESVRHRPEYRMWRRLMIVEGLKRGIITKDPGPNGTVEGR